MKLLLSFYLCVLLGLAGTAQSLQVSKNNRYLETEDGKPFLWLGDTAWELFHKLNREEALEYLDKRKEQGFTVIQAVILAENDGLRTPNPYGDIPLIDFSPVQPNEAYFEHVDFIMDAANERGLYVGLLPTWGDKLYSPNPGAGPEVFTKENAKVFGAFLGSRYRDHQLVWILGGDRIVGNAEVMEIWRAMAIGLASGDEGTHLISYHPRGATSSSYWLHNEDWLDFNMYQSGHTHNFMAVYDFAEVDWLKQPIKPTLEAEPAYEDMPLSFWEYIDWKDPKRIPDSALWESGLLKEKTHFPEGYFTDYDVRVHAYWNLLSGSLGYTYGNNTVWQMFKKGGPYAIPCLTDWHEALDRPGANDIRHIRSLFERYAFEKLIPDQSIVYGKNSKGENHIRAAQSADKSFLMVYLAKGQSVDIYTGKMQQDFTVRWFNPRNGEMIEGESLEPGAIRSFLPPGQGVGNDWMLVLDAQED